MGNVSSSAEPPSSESRVLLLLWVLHRYWSNVVDHVDGATLRRRRRKNGGGRNDVTRRRRYNEGDSSDETPFEYSDSDGSSEDYCYSDFRLDRAEMSPNSEDDGRLLPVKDCAWNNVNSDKEQRPPVYNPEDYAISLKKWGRRSSGGASLYVGGQPQAPPEELKTRTLGAQGSRGSQEKMSAQGSRGSQEIRDYRNPNLTPTPEGGEMSLKQFSSVSELLGKLKADLRLAFPSFVQEFIGDPLDGVTLLLELLRAVQLSQASQQMRCPPPVLRRALLDEYSCLLCLKHCMRCADAGRRLAATPAGLFTLAVCIMSNVSKSRVTALELLTKACEPPGNGHGAVSEALSTLRLRFGEPVRFRFLVGMLSSAGGCPELQAAGMKFLNTFLETSPGPQSRLYIQAELEQAGFQAQTLRKVLPSDPDSADKVRAELSRWERNYVDVDALKCQSDEAGEKTEALRDKVTLLERRVQILQEEKGILLSLEQCLKERCCELESEVQHLRKTSKRAPPSTPSGSTPAEDEGISSSDQDQDEDVEREPMVYEVFAVQNDTIMMERAARNGLVGDQSEWRRMGDHVMKETSVDQEDDDETTIDEVIEELRNIINDAESEEFAKDEAERRQREFDEGQQKREGDEKTTTTTTTVKEGKSVEEQRENVIRKGNVEGDYYKDVNKVNSRQRVDVPDVKPASPKGSGGKLEEEAKRKTGEVKQTRKTNVKKVDGHNGYQPPRITIQAAKNNQNYFNLHNETQVKVENNKNVKTTNYYTNHEAGIKFGVVNVKITADNNINKIGVKNNSYLMNDLGSAEVVDAIETEVEIVPVRLLPQPPRKSRSVVHIVHGRDYVEEGLSTAISPFFDDETPSHTSEDDSDSLLSCARDRRTAHEPDMRTNNLSAMFNANRDYGKIYRYQVTQDEPNNIRNNGITKNMNVVKRSETFQHTNENYQNRKSEHKKENVKKIDDDDDMFISGRNVDSGRRGSFDGLFFVTDYSTTTVSTPSQTELVFNTKNEEKWSESKKLQSKSLDRIDEGLDSLVDIVISPTERGNKSRFSSGRGSSEDWSVEWGDNYSVQTKTRRSVMDVSVEKPSPVVVVRSSSIQQKTTTTTTRTQPKTSESFKFGEYQSTRFPQRLEEEKGGVKRYPPDGSSQPLFLPSRVHAEPPRTKQSPPNTVKNNGFIIKRGHTNAGLYSGHHNIRDSPGQIGIKQKVMNPNAEYGRNISPVISRTQIPKVTDLPSGLY